MGVSASAVFCRYGVELCADHPARFLIQVLRRRFLVSTSLCRVVLNVNKVHSLEVELKGISDGLRAG